jgi:hypothetical protein
MSRALDQCHTNHPRGTPASDHADWRLHNTKCTRSGQIVQSSYLAACIAECQQHHIFISMQASRIRDSFLVSFIFTHYPICTVLARMENSGARFRPQHMHSSSVSDRRARSPICRNEYRQQKHASLKYSTSASSNCPASERVVTRNHSHTNKRAL